MSEQLPADGNAAALSLLSLKTTESIPIPPPIKRSPSQDVHSGSSSLGTRSRGPASTSKSRRRMSDARESATRPAISTPLSLASLTLSPPRTTTSAMSPPSERPYIGQYGVTPFVGSPYSTRGAVAAAAAPALRAAKPLTPAPEPEHLVHSGKGSKKRGATTFICESCSKVYRHPSCLIKHRWEHTSHWKEASPFVLSKHQQVQLLEAAAILSHLDPSASTAGTSLPEDRSLWPSFFSGGSIPSPAGSSVPISSSVSVVTPSSPRSFGGGPRMHDYAIPKSASSGNGITQLRPGLLGVPTAIPASVPNGSMHHRRYSSSSSPGGGGWSLPQSSLRSAPTTSSREASSRSRSGSGSRSEDEDIELPELGEEDDYVSPRPRYGYSSRGRWTVSEENEDEDGDSLMDVVLSAKERARAAVWDGGDLDMDMD